MDVKNYLENQIKKSGHYELTEQDNKLLEKGVEDFIFRKLMSKKFRKWSLPEAVQKMIREDIADRVKNQKPIKLTLAYGGFKLWRLTSSPEVDWSEFFYIAYHLKYMAPIAATYKPGIHLEFSSGDIAVTTMNNVPREDVDRYDASMRTMVEVFTPHLPENISIGVSRLRDLFDSEETFIYEGEKLRESARKAFTEDNHLAEEFRLGALQNIQLEGGREDISHLSEAGLADYRARASEIVFAMYEMPQIAAIGDDEGINLMATNIDLPIPMITTGCSKYSTAKFWAGLGVLAENNDSYADYVLTPKQWDKLKDQPHETMPVDLVPLDNCKEILVYPKKFSF